jgi:hypothetical protein
MRSQGRIRLGYYPLPTPEAHRIARHVLAPAGGYAALDPCAGCGTALAVMTDGHQAQRCGIELDAYRAEESARVLTRVIQGNCFDVHCAVESFSLLYLNPPYDFEIGERQNQRMETLFLEHTFRWLRPGGVLVMVIPVARLADCGDVLAVHFRDKTVYRLSAPESVKYQQVVVFGVRRTHQERSRVKDMDVSQARRKLAEMARQYGQLPVLPDSPERRYVIPPGGPAHLVFRGIPLDAVEDLLANSAGHRQVNRIAFAPGARATGRPLTPLHGGHVGLLATSGLLNGAFGSGERRHLAVWESVKVVDRFEEVEDGVTTIRERERFTQTLTLAFRDGRTAILTDRSRTHEERAPSNGHAAVSQGGAGDDSGCAAVDGSARRRV